MCLHNKLTSMKGESILDWGRLDALLALERGLDAFFLALLSTISRAPSSLRFLTTFF